MAASDTLEGDLVVAGAMDAPGAAVAASAEAQSEAAWVQRLLRRDPEAFEQLVRLHQDRVWDFCVRMLGDRSEAEDVAQEIFVSIHQNLRRFRADSKLSTWIYRVCKNHCLNRLKYLQRRGRGRSTELADVSEATLAEAAGGPPSPQAHLELAAERARVQRAIAQLEPDARALVVLRDIEGLSYEEMVEVTELPEGTVKSRLHRARERLAQILGQLEE